jgi:hypothetical protein
MYFVITASHFKTDVIIIDMPGRMPAKKFRTVLFDSSIAAADVWAADEQIFNSQISPKTYFLCVIIQ